MARAVPVAKQVSGAQYGQLAAEVADEDAYERMPIEQFGKAYLRGYNWKEGDGMGRNGEQIEAVEYVPRPQLLGLGASSSDDDDEPQKALNTEKSVLL